MQTVIPDDLLPPFEEIQILVKELLSQVAEEDFISVPEETLKAIYHYAFNLYQQGRYEQSEHFFRLLTYLKAFDSNYWIGLGAARQMQKNYVLALEAYGAAQVLDFKNINPEPALQSAHCFFDLKQKKEGLKSLKKAYLSAKKNHNNKLLEHIDLLRSIWSNKAI